MATFDKLSAEQRAIVELILQRGQTYEGLADMLAMPVARVRELAREALGSLAPRTAARVDADWRGQIADYVLGQQTGPEAAATRGHLKRSEEARAWARSLIDSLDDLYRGPLPEVPAPEAPVRGRRARPEREPAAPLRPLSPEAQATVRRRRLVGGALGLVAVVGAVLLLTGVIGGGDDDGDEASDASDRGTPTQTGQQQQPTVLGQVVLRAIRGGKGTGIAVLTERGGERQLVVQARDLEPNRSRQAYEVWLFNSPKEAKSIGAQVTDRQGNYQGAGPLPSDYERYRYIDISREKIDENTAHSGTSVLRGDLRAIRQG